MTAEIVSTPDTLGGTPRIDGHRIGVLDILAALETGHDPEDIHNDYYPTLTEDEAHVAVEWLHDHPDERRELRLDSLLAREEGQKTGTKPPMETYVESNRFISLELDDVSGVTLHPTGRYTRIYYDPLHESHAVYDIDLQNEVVTPIHDEGDLTLSDAYHIAADYNDGQLIADAILVIRSVKLGDIYETN